MGGVTARASAATVVMLAQDVGRRRNGAAITSSKVVVRRAATIKRRTAAVPGNFLRTLVHENTGAMARSVVLNRRIYHAPIHTHR